MQPESELSQDDVFDAFVDAGFRMPERDEVHSHKFKVRCHLCDETRSDKEDPAMMVMLDTGGYKCFYCQESGRVKVRTAKGAIRRAVSSRPRHYAKPEPHPVSIGRGTANWFETVRGISLETLKAMRVGSGECYVPAARGREMCVWFPFYEAGEYVNFKARSATKNFAAGKDCRLLPWNADVLLDPDVECVVFVEGEMDVLSCIEAGVTNVVSVPNGASKNNNLAWLDPYEDAIAGKTFVIAVDADAPGDGLREDLVRRLGKDSCRIAEYPAGFKDLNEVLVGLGAGYVRSCVEEADYPPVEAIADRRAVKRRALYYMDHAIPPGTQTGRYPKFDEIASFERSSVSIVQGMPNMGKSVFADNIMCATAINGGARWAAFSWEKPDPAYHSVSLAQQWAETNKEAMSLEEREAAIDEVLDAIALIETPKLPTDRPSDVLDVARACVRRFGVTHVMLDNFMFLEREADVDDVNEGDAAKFIAIKEFAVRENVHVLVVAHPKKLQERKAKGGLGAARKEYDAPEGYDLLGSSKLFNVVDLGITIHGPLGGNYVDAIVWKCRNDWAGKQGRVKLRKEFAYRGYSEALPGEIDDLLAPGEQTFNLTAIS